MRIKTDDPALGGIVLRFYIAANSDSEQTAS